MQPQDIKTRNRSQDEPRAEIESGETNPDIKFQGLNSCRAGMPDTLKPGISLPC